MDDFDLHATCLFPSSLTTHHTQEQDSAHQTRCVPYLGFNIRVVRILHQADALIVAMAFSLGLTDRFDGFRLQRSNTSSSNDEPSFSFYTPTPRVTNSRPVSQSSGLDTRASLQRRFTTQSVSTLSSLAPIGQQRRSGVETNGLTETVGQDIPNHRTVYVFQHACS